MNSLPAQRPAAPQAAPRPAAALPPRPAAAAPSLRARHSSAFVSARPPPALAPRRRANAVAAASDAGPSSWMDQPESQPLPDAGVEVYPRARERDPYARLGLPPDASFEEVQDARNFLVEQYRPHAPSREAIEGAFDTILKRQMKERHRLGFRPPSRGRRGDAAADAPRLSVLAEIRRRFEPSVPGTTIVNDGSIFAALGLWAAWQAASSDPTLPLGAAVAFCAWRLYDKRMKRDPDGPHLGGSPIFGALGTTVLGLVAGGLASYLLVQALPLPPRVSGEAAGLFFIALGLGFTAIFLK